MKRFFTLALLVSLTLVSCAKEQTATVEGAEKGRVEITLGVATEVDATRAEATYKANCTTPAAEDFKLVIEGVKYDDGSNYNFSKEYASIAEFNGEYFYRGYYRATVSAGDVTEEGYDKPAFEGVSPEEEGFHVVPRENVEVAITAYIANALVLVEVTDGFKNYFTGGHTFDVVTAAGNTFEDVTAAENVAKGPIFVAPTSFKVVGEAIKQANQSGGNPIVVAMEDTFDNLAARTLYRVKMDVDTAGGATLKITLNDTLVEERTIDEELNPWAPAE